MAGNYPWIDFYMVFADKLQMFRQDRSCLIRKLQNPGISFDSDDGVNVQLFFVDVVSIEESLSALRYQLLLASERLMIDESRSVDPVR